MLNTCPVTGLTFSIIDDTDLAFDFPVTISRHPLASPAAIKKLRAAGRLDLLSNSGLLAIILSTLYNDSLIPATGHAASKIIAASNKRELLSWANWLFTKYPVGYKRVGGELPRWAGFQIEEDSTEKAVARQLFSYLETIKEEMFPPTTEGLIYGEVQQPLSKHFDRLTTTDFNSLPELRDNPLLTAKKLAAAWRRHCKMLVEEAGIKQAAADKLLKIIKDGPWKLANASYLEDLTDKLASKNNAGQQLADTFQASKHFLLWREPVKDKVLLEELEEALVVPEAPTSPEGANLENELALSKEEETKSQAAPAKKLSLAEILAAKKAAAKNGGK